MITRKDKVQAEIDKTKDKIAELQTKLKDLETKYVELENIEIVEFVRGLNVPLNNLPDVLKSAKSTSPSTPTSSSPLLNQDGDVRKEN